jgi:hypothetical protein
MLTALLLTSLTLTAAAGDGGGRPPPPRRSEARDRVPLGEGADTRVTFDPFTGRMTLSPMSEAGATRLAKALSARCRFERADGSAAVLACEEKRLEVRVTSTPAGRVLEVTSLRGLPFFVDDPLRRLPYFRPTEKEPCLSARALEQGECSLSDRKVREARAHFESARGEDPEQAALRLGDLEADGGRLAEAADWYRKVGRVGPFGRLARARLCELEGGCFSEGSIVGEGQVFDPVALPPPMGAEMVLRAARAAMISGRYTDAATVLRRYDAMNPTSGACREASTLCRRMILTLFEAGPSLVAPDALDLFFQLDLEALDTEERLALIRAATARAAELGGASFAAAWLATLTDEVPKRDRVAHLEQVALLYLDGGEHARARVVAEYATSIARTDAEKRRTAVLLARVDRDAAGAEDTDAEVELARRVLKQARALKSGAAASP